MNRGCWTAVLVAVLLGGTAWAQSLGEAAQRERKRREAVAQQRKGEPSKVVTEEELRQHSGGPPLDMGAEPQLETPTESAAGALTSSPAKEATRASDAGTEKKRQLAERLRQRLADCEDRVADATRELALAEEHRSFVSRKTNSSYSMNEARQRLRSAEAAVEQAKQQCDVIEDEARVGGIPPGWIR